MLVLVLDGLEILEAVGGQQGVQLKDHGFQFLQLVARVVLQGGVLHNDKQSLYRPEEGKFHTFPGAVFRDSKHTGVGTSV